MKGLTAAVYIIGLVILIISVLLFSNASPQLFIIGRPETVQWCGGNLCKYSFGQQASDCSTALRDVTIQGDFSGKDVMSIKTYYDTAGHRFTPTPITTQNTFQKTDNEIKVDTISTSLAADQLDLPCTWFIEVTLADKVIPPPPPSSAKPFIVGGGLSDVVDSTPKQITAIVLNDGAEDGIFDVYVDCHQNNNKVKLGSTQRITLPPNDRQTVLISVTSNSSADVQFQCTEVAADVSNPTNFHTREISLDVKALQPPLAPPDNQIFIIMILIIIAALTGAVYWKLS